MKNSILNTLFAVFIVGCSQVHEKQSETTTQNPPGKIVFTSGKAIGKEKLSDYAFFEGELANLNPTEEVHPYTLNSPLFSDYAHKARFVKLPTGKSAEYHPTEVLQFPLGTVLIKNFYYPADFRKPEGKRRIIETRLLINEEKGWKALPYVWNEQQTDAYLEVAGATKSVSWRDTNGKLKQLKYSVPNMNQCRSCHLKSGKIMPIGPTVRQLNGEYAYRSGNSNQIEYWKHHNMLKQLPHGDLPKLVDYRNGEVPLADRARAYLEINCGHCHRPEGPAKNSALHLMASVENKASLGVGKTPVAAGKGSGGLQYDIVPGEPDASILYYRMASQDPGIMMPELGRKMIHKEGLALVKEWIREMD